MKINFSKNKIVLYTHNSGGDGNYDDELFDYFLKNNIFEIIKMDFPFGKKSEKTIRFKYFKTGKVVKQFQSIIKFSSPSFLSYIKDIIYGIFYGFKYLKNTDYFFGMDNLLAAVGLFFKKIGFVKYTYYCIIDYTPIRYENYFLNKFYYFLDKVCLYNCDCVISLNSDMINQRIIDKNLDKNKINYKIAPFGNHSFEKKDIEYQKYDLNRLVYFGGVLKSKGSELFIDIAKGLIKKGFDNLVFEVIGGGDIDWLSEQIRLNNLEKYFHIHGRIDNYRDIEEILLNSSIAVAPYYSEDKNSFSYHSDPGKVKFYLGCGLPIVITDVPPIAKDIVTHKAGLIADYEADDFVDKILKILGNYGFYRDNAIRLGKEFDWNIIFNNIINSD